MSAGGEGPGGAIADFVAAIFGASASAIAWRSIGAREGPTALWIAEAGVASLVVKVHLRGRGFAQERAAYRALAGPLSRWLPALVGEAPELGALALARLDGSPADGDVDPAIHREAGAFLRALHEVATDRLGAADPMPLEVAIDRRWQAALAGAAPVLGEARCARLAPRVRPSIFRGVARALAHRDFAPANWIVGAGDRLRVVDLEHARADDPLVDRVLLEAGAWGRATGLRAAFDAGYGRGLDDHERARLDALRLVDAVTTVTWARRHGDARRRDDAEALLTALDGDDDGGPVPRPSAYAMLPR